MIGTQSGYENGKYQEFGHVRKTASLTCCCCDVDEMQKIVSRIVGALLFLLKVTTIIRLHENHWKNRHATKVTAKLLLSSNGCHCCNIILYMCMYVYIYIKKKAEMTNKNYCETNSACVFPICSGGIYSIAWKSHQKVLHLHTHTIFCTYFAIAHKINRTICLAGIYIYTYIASVG